MMPITSSVAPPTEALLAICVHAALADGAKGDAERSEIRRLAQDLSAESAGPIIQKVLLGQWSLADAAAAITEPAHRLLAYEMALGVCEADEEIHPSEREFLERLRGLLGLENAAAGAAEQRVSEIVLAPVPVAAAVPATRPPALPGVAAVDNSGMILRYAILNGALELLPETLATMAIVPLQVKMVYRIGQTHGVPLDQSHIKEFIATIGAGLASQMVEGFARKLAGSFFKKALGKMAGKVANQAAGSLFSFGSTYAIGMVADRYYAGGRKFSASELRAQFQDFTQKAKGLYEIHRPQIEKQSRQLDVGTIFSLLKKEDPVAAPIGGV